MKRVSRVFLLFLIALCLWDGSVEAGTEYHLTIPTSLGDTTETFWLQIPEGYEPGTPRPLLVGWHQLWGDEMELKEATGFPAIADRRGWIAVCHRGPSTTHWNNQAAQSHVVDLIRWIEDRYAIDRDRIYMIGSSMGGAAGMVFSSNHLDPSGVMVAAAASVSGIQDCERRFHEQGYNSSMAGAFGGTPEEVPLEYHRNSAIFFADSVESMHRNATHLPLWLTFGSGGSDAIWRAHAEDLYAVMAGYADSVVLRESSLAGHGWVCAEEEAICAFLDPFRADRYPATIAVNADEEGGWYWCDLQARRVADRFARFDGEIDVAGARATIVFVANAARVEVDLAPLGFPLDGRPFTIDWAIRDAGAAELGIAGVPQQPAGIFQDGLPFEDWSYDGFAQQLLLSSQRSAVYLVHFDPASVAGNTGAPSTIRVWVVGDEIRFTGLPSGRIGWALHDCGGRGVAGGEAPAASGAIAIPERTARGIYFVTLSGRGRGRQVVTKILLPSRP